MSPDSPRLRLAFYEIDQPNEHFRSQSVTTYRNKLMFCFPEDYIHVDIYIFTKGDDLCKTM